MSESSKDGDYCQKCGAPVDPTDEKCPNGHVLAEVGRAFVRSASSSLKLIQGQIVTSSHEIAMVSGEVVKSAGSTLQAYEQLKGTFDVNQVKIAKEIKIEEEIRAVSDNSKRLVELGEKQNKNLEKLYKDFKDYVEGQSKRFIISIVVAVVAVVVAVVAIIISTR